MPNWCYTTYKIVGDDAQLAKIKDMLDELNGMKEPRVENGFGKLWLGCIVDYLGGDWEKVKCRGSVEQYEMCDDCLRLNCEVAWAESPEFRHFVEDKFPGIKIYHYSEEPGMAGYWTNDTTGKYFPDRYYLDSCKVYVESEYFSDIDEAARYINNLNIEGLHVEPDFKSISDAIDDYVEKYGEDNWMAFHEIEVIED